MKRKTIAFYKRWSFLLDLFLATIQTRYFEFLDASCINHE